MAHKTEACYPRSCDANTSVIPILHLSSVNRHIAMVTGNFPARSETFVLNHAVGLSTRGYSVSVISAGSGDGITENDMEVLKNTGVKLHYVSGFGDKRLPNLIQLIKVLFRHPSMVRYLAGDVSWSRREFFEALLYKKRLERIEPDLIHFHFGTHAAPIVLLGIKCPAIVTWHGYDANEIPQRRGTKVYRDLFANTFIHTVGSEFMRDRLVALGATREQIHKIPMGVNIETFSPSHDSPSSHSPLRILSVGRLDEMKGHTYLISAAVELIKAGADITVRIIGNGPLRKELESQILESGYGEKIGLLGPCSPRRILKELRCTHLFALTGVVASTGRVETQGVALIEAQATEIPVISSKVGGIPESILNGETGILCEPGNVAQIVAAISKFIEQPDLKKQYGKRGRQFVSEHFSLDAMVDRFEAIYRKLIH